MSAELSPPTDTSDRVCENIAQAGCTNFTVCTSWQYELSPPSGHNVDRVCAPLTNCTQFQFESTPPTPTTDRKCTNITLEVFPTPSILLNSDALLLGSPVSHRLATGDIVYTQNVGYYNNDHGHIQGISVEAALGPVAATAQMVVQPAPYKVNVTIMSDSNIYPDSPRVLFLIQLLDTTGAIIQNPSSVPFARLAYPTPAGISTLDFTCQLDNSTGLLKPLLVAIPDAVFTYVAAGSTASVAFGLDGSVLPSVPSKLLNLKPLLPLSVSGEIAISLPASSLTASASAQIKVFLNGTSASTPVQSWGLSFVNFTAIH